MARGDTPIIGAIDDAARAPGTPAPALIPFKLSLSIGGMLQAPSQSEAQGTVADVLEVLSKALPELVLVEVNSHIVRGQPVARPSE